MALMLRGLLFSGPTSRHPRAAAPSLPRLTTPGAPFPGWVPQGEAVLGLPVLQRNVPEALPAGTVLWGVFFLSKQMSFRIKE